MPKNTIATHFPSFEDGFPDERSISDGFGPSIFGHNEMAPRGAMVF